MTWNEAMNKYGIDKPDMRIPMEMVSLEEVFKDGENPFAQLVANGGTIKGLRLPGGATLSRKELSDLEGRAKSLGAKGMANFQVKEGELKGPLVKFLNEEQLAKLRELSAIENGDALFIMADESWRKACEILGQIRLELGRARGMVEEGFRFLWVTEFPLFEWDDESGRYTAVHHPFTAPMDEDVQYMLTEPGKVRSRAYDVVLNGTELGGGSIRIHNPEMQQIAFRALNFTPEAAKERFGFLLEGLSYGTPPHGGLAIGPPRHAHDRQQVDTRRHGLPEEPEGPVPDDGGSIRSRIQAARRAFDKGSRAARLNAALRKILKSIKDGRPNARRLFCA